MIPTATDRAASLDAVPDSLRSLNQWVVYRILQRGPARKATKVPFVASWPSKGADSTDPRTWCPFAFAARQYARTPDLAGVGFVFRRGGGLVGVDLDDSLGPDGALRPWAARTFDLIGAAGTYGEVSPSGRGVKLVGEGELPADPATGDAAKGRNRRRGTKADPLPGGIEVYPDSRFFAITGRRFAGSAAAVGPFDAGGLAALYARLAPPPPRVARVLGPVLVPGEVGDRVDRCWRYLLRCPDAVSGSGGHNATLRAAAECVRFDLSDAEALDVMRRWSASKSGGEPWTDRELEHKLRSAEKHAGHERGRRIREGRASLTRARAAIVIPARRDRGAA